MSVVKLNILNKVCWNLPMSSTIRSMITKLLSELFNKINVCSFFHAQKLLIFIQKKEKKNPTQKYFNKLFKQLFYKFCHGILF